MLIMACLFLFLCLHFSLTKVQKAISPLLPSVNDCEAETEMSDFCESTLLVYKVLCKDEPLFLLVGNDHSSTVMTKGQKLPWIPTVFLGLSLKA